MCKKGNFDYNDIILKKDGAFMSFQNILDKYGNTRNFLEYASLIFPLNEYLKTKRMII